MRVSPTSSPMLPRRGKEEEKRGPVWAAEAIVVPPVGLLGFAGALIGALPLLQKQSVIPGPNRASFVTFNGLSGGYIVGKNIVGGLFWCLLTLCCNHWLCTDVFSDMSPPLLPLKDKFFFLFLAVCVTLVAFYRRGVFPNSFPV
jgi:hypothetical protein